LVTTIILLGASPAVLIVTALTCLFKLAAQKTQQLMPEKYEIQETNNLVLMIYQITSRIDIAKCDYTDTKLPSSTPLTTPQMQRYQPTSVAYAKGIAASVN
jgi:hypothetical protein